VPSDQGYRFYVDRLMSAQPLSPRERRTIRQLQQRIHEQVDEILREACRVVAELTRYTSIATPPIASASRLESIRLLFLDGRRILVVLVMESGRVEHLVVDAAGADSARVAVESLQTALNLVFGNKMCGELTAAPDFSSYPPPMARVLNQISSSIRDGLRPPQEDELVVQGEVNALREPEFQDLKRLDGLLNLLHSRKSIYNMLSGVGIQQPLAVIIGSESGYDKASEYSFVAARYSIGSTFAGAIGVFGPTRMRYSQAVPVVQTVAREVSAVLTTLMGGTEVDDPAALH
ncbi:MAG: hypothetical protein M3Y56_06190, partial [Armatimonadota bacterium]|nr:hypothetical protein [Armatimonadota bacterium]